MHFILIAVLFIFFQTELRAESNITLNVSLSPAGSFQAVSKKMKGKLIKQNNLITSDKIVVMIESFKTGIDLRDEHFWKHLQSTKYPKATLTDLKAQKGVGTANLEVNDVKKQITITYVEKDNEVHAEFNVKASDFSLQKAEYLGVGVSDEVRVNAILSY